VTVFHLVRHGEHVWRGRGILAGRSAGVGLTAAGRIEIGAIGEQLAGEEIVALYASPLQRTRESAEILAARLGLRVQCRDDLIELDFGEWTGLSFDEVRRDDRWEAWRTRRSLAAVPGGESMRQVQVRAVDALAELHRTHERGTVVVVSHGDVIRSALLFVLGMPLDLYARIEIDLASISTIEFADFGFCVRRLNERPLRRTGQSAAPPPDQPLPRPGADDDDIGASRRLHARLPGHLQPDGDG
jgi:broad specificity phosphatase PhoE